MSVENKKCPHCGAEIEENARFCLYCMTVLDEKERVSSRLYLRKRWLILSAAFFALLLIGGGVLLIFGKSKPEENRRPSDLSQEQQGSTQAPSENDLQEGGAFVSQNQEEILGIPSGGGSEQSGPTLPQQGGSSSTEEGTGSNSSGNIGQSSSSTQTQSGASQTQGGTSQTPSGSSQVQGETSQSQGEDSNEVSDGKEEQPTPPSQPSQTPTEQNPSEESAPEQSQPSDAPTQQEPEQTAPIFTYRQMKYGDDYHTNAAVTDDKIVLTGIQTPAIDGIYHIPSTIDGKTVIAIEASAFYNSGHALTVKKIYIPSTLRTVWGSAFVGCYNLTDVYLYGKSIYIDPWAFPSVDKRNGTLTIHCSSDCSNRDFRYYKNIASSYFDAEYVEWNG